MKPEQIRIGRAYVQSMTSPRRLVLGIGQAYRPGTHGADGVYFEQTGPGGAVSYRRGYLDTFARWARKEVKP